MYLNGKFSESKGVMMRINKFAAAVMLGASALALSACATGFPANVSRFQAMPAPQGQSFVVVPMDARNLGGLEFSRYADMVGQAMQAQGYARAGSIEQASMVVRVGYGVDQGQTQIVHDPFMARRSAAIPNIRAGLTSTFAARPTMPRCSKARRTRARPTTISARSSPI